MRESTATAPKRYRPLGSLIRVQDKGFLNESDRAAIKEIFSNPKWTMPEKLDRAFDVYRSARLRSVAPADRERIRAYLESLKVEYSDGVHISGSAAKIRLPASMKDTAILYALRAHEQEHRFQYFEYFGFEDYGAGKADYGTGKAILLILSQQFGVRTTYFAEREAMKAEWEVLHSFPDETIDLAIKVMERPEFNNTFSQRRTLHMLRHSRLNSVEDYLEAEHRAGRYTYGEIAEGVLLWKILPVISALYFLGDEAYSYLHKKTGHN